MDLSQQELPLTTYFTRTSKDTKSRASSCKRNKPTEGSPSVARSSKRKKNDDQRATTSPLNSIVGQSRLQLPTPVTSVRRRTRTRHEELSTEVLPSSVEQNAVSGGAEATLDDGVEILKLPSATRAMPSTNQRRSPPCLRFFRQAETGLVTPRTLSRRIPEPVRDAPHAQFSFRSTLDHPCSSVDCADPFCAHEKSAASISRGTAPAPLKLPLTQSKTLDCRPSDDRIISMIPVQSSQSQYLLHPDATPKSKRHSRHIEHVVSSQILEEKELTISTPRKLATPVGGVSSGKYTPRERAQILPPSSRERKSLVVNEVGSTSVGSPSIPPARLLRSSLTTRKVPDELLSNSLSPSRRKLYLSPKKSPRRSIRRDSIENIPPAHVEDSLTESESDPDILQVKMKDSLVTYGLSSREMISAPHHSPTPRSAHSPIRCARGIPSTEDDSATEAESDTEILRCVAEIGRKQRRRRPSGEAREDFPPPIISPLVSPARSRIAIAASIPAFTQPPEGSGSSASYLSNAEQPLLHSESLPSVVRDFIHMFPGDESYPADFPGSLRI